MIECRTKTTNRTSNIGNISLTRGDKLQEAMVNRGFRTALEAELGPIPSHPLAQNLNPTPTP
jgi:hypothetical protein